MVKLYMYRVIQPLLQQFRAGTFREIGLIRDWYVAYSIVTVTSKISYP